MGPILWQLSLEEIEQIDADPNKDNITDANWNDSYHFRSRDLTLE